MFLGDLKCFSVWETRSSGLLEVYFIPLWISICTSPGAHLWGYKNCLFPSTNVSRNAACPLVLEQRLLQALKATRRKDTHKKSFADFFSPSKPFFSPVKERRGESEPEWEPRDLILVLCLPFPSTVTKTSYPTTCHRSVLIDKHTYKRDGRDHLAGPPSPKDPGFSTFHRG